MTSVKGAMPTRSGSRVAHGTYSRYVAGCRCESCTVANRVYKRTLKRSKSHTTKLWGPTPETLTKLGRRTDYLGVVL